MGACHPADASLGRGAQALPLAPAAARHPVVAPSHGPGRDRNQDRGLAGDPVQDHSSEDAPVQGAHDAGLDPYSRQEDVVGWGASQEEAQAA